MIRSTAFWSPATVILGGTLFAAGYFDSQDQTRIWFLIAAASWLVATSLPTLAILIFNFSLFSWGIRKSVDKENTMYYLGMHSL
ncbi:MAG: hypothetical protein AAF539_16325, partial [Planctomycetota bacterium]